MWIGVLRGLAGLKFSGSPIENGKIKEITERTHKKIIIPNKSFDEK